MPAYRIIIDLKTRQLHLLNKNIVIPTYYGIHGTNDPSSIGKMVSHGCIRMYNDDLLKLSKFVTIETRVTIR